jgi:hypothetical protein
MKMTKTQRRLVSKLMFPIVALVMMTLTMALAGTSHSAPIPAPITST